MVVVVSLALVDVDVIVFGVNVVLPRVVSLMIVFVVVVVVLVRAVVLVFCGMVFVLEIGLAPSDREWQLRQSGMTSSNL